MKKSFSLYIDSLDVLDQLSDEDAGKLFKAIRAYEVDETEILEGLLKAVFVPFKNNIDRAKDSYSRVVEANKANGLKGGRPKRKKANGFTKNPKNPNKDKDKDKDINIGIFSEDEYVQLKSYRSQLKKPFKTQQAVTGLSNSFKQCYDNGYTFTQLFELMQEKQWQSIKLEWAEKEIKPKNINLIASQF